MEYIERTVDEHRLQPVAVLLTHGHFDHMWQAADVANKYDATVWIHPEDEHLLTEPLAAISNESGAILRTQFGLDDGIELPAPQKVAAAIQGATITVGSLTIGVDHVPGHTQGSVVYRCDYDGSDDISQIMFTGDFVFAGAIGRVDLAGGSNEQMRESLQWILTQNDDIALLPGHGPQSTLARERLSNPFLLEVT